MIPHWQSKSFFNYACIHEIDSTEWESAYHLSGAPQLCFDWEAIFSAMWERRFYLKCTSCSLLSWLGHKAGLWPNFLFLPLTSCCYMGTFRMCWLRRKVSHELKVIRILCIVWAWWWWARKISHLLRPLRAAPRGLDMSSWSWQRQVANSSLYPSPLWSL